MDFPYKIVYRPRNEPGCLGFELSVTDSFLEVLCKSGIDKEAQERYAQKVSDDILKIAHSGRVLGWAEHLLQRIMLPGAHAAGMTFEEDSKSWCPHNIDTANQMAVCLAIMTKYFNTIASLEYLRKETQS